MWDGGQKEALSCLLKGDCTRGPGGKSLQYSLAAVAAGLEPVTAMLCVGWRSPVAGLPNLPTG